MQTTTIIRLASNTNSGLPARLYSLGVSLDRQRILYRCAGSRKAGSEVCCTLRPGLLSSFWDCSHGQVGLVGARIRSLFGILMDVVVSSIGSFHCRKSFLTAFSIDMLVGYDIIRDERRLTKNCMWLHTTMTTRFPNSSARFQWFTITENSKALFRIHKRVRQIWRMKSHGSPLLNTFRYLVA